ncbi:hypothetical protein FACS189473_2210 [Spirochaetia bacterium]|nr:hypothetical protein FACS189473_2210 [Spirochaetia bacterium]
MKTRTSFIITVFLIMGIALAACGQSKEEKAYGKILNKKPDEKTIVKAAQDAVFDYNKNIVFKEALASNPYAENITWQAAPATLKGAWIVDVSYDIAYRSLFDSPSLRAEAVAVSPVGISNMVTHFIKAEIEDQHSHDYTADELNGMIDAYVTAYNEKFDDKTLLSAALSLSDGGPSEYMLQNNPPFFTVENGKFIGEILVEPGTGEVTFIRHTVLLNFTIPSMDNKQVLAGKTDEEGQHGLMFIYDDMHLIDIYAETCLYPAAATIPVHGRRLKQWANSNSLNDMYY